jgi:hypothetical protein
VTRDQKIHDDAITRAYPASLGVPFQESFASPRPRWGRYRQKLRSTLDGITMLLAVRPDRPVSEWLKGAGRLRRPSRDTYRMYASCIEELDAEKATRLLELAAELHAARPRDLITDRLDPVAQATDNQEAA